MNTVDEDLALSLRRDADVDPIDALARALQPLVAELQEAGLGVGEWIEAIKIASYQAARAATDARAGRAIFTRMSVRTGMTRVELQRLRRKLHEDVDARPRLIGRQRTARVIEGWCTNPLYSDALGRPLALPMAGSEPSLQSLIRLYAGDVPNSSVIAEMRDQGLLVRQGGGRFKPRLDAPKALLRRIRALEQWAQSSATSQAVKHASAALRLRAPRSYPELQSAAPGA